MITIREYQKTDMAAAVEIWNEVVREGVAFPQVEELTEQEADGFFSSQSYTGVAADSETGEIVGLYILHPHGCVLPTRQNKGAGWGEMGR